MSCIADPKEVKRQRERDRYSQKKYDINKRRREAYKQKKTTTADINDRDKGTHTPFAVSNGKDNQVVHTCLATKHIPDYTLQIQGKLSSFSLFKISIMFIWI